MHMRWKTINENETNCFWNLMSQKNLQLQDS